MFRTFRSRGLYQVPCAVFGYGEIGIELKEFFQTHPEQGFNFLGFFTKEGDQQNVAGGIDKLKSMIENKELEEVYISVPDVSNEQIQEVMDLCENFLVRVMLVPNFLSFYSRRLGLDFFGTIPVLITQQVPLSDPINRFIKRGFDVLFSLFIIVFVLSWLIPLLALFIFIDNPGPIFFVQNRSGFKNKDFKVFKFRSMVVNNETETQATKDDKRITRVGAILRKTSLDELPQFFNVLIGTMSVVGPRPHPLFLTEEYSKSIERYMVRHFVKPGITGLAQVQGYRGETKDPNLMKIRVKMDRVYIEQWSIWLDLKIVFQTLGIAFKRQEYAY